jgi:hypothetical protein
MELHGSLCFIYYLLSVCLQYAPGCMPMVIHFDCVRVPDRFYNSISDRQQERISEGTTTTILKSMEEFKMILRALIGIILLSLVFLILF